MASRMLHIALWVSGFVIISGAVTTVFIEECKPGKYFWKEKLPTEFYACLTLPRRAVKLRCPPGTYMCNTGPDFFQPCMCKGKLTKYFKHYGIPEKKYHTDKLKQLTGSSNFNDVITQDIQHMMSTESVLSDQVRGPEGKQGPEDFGNHVFDGDLPEPSLPHSGCPDDFRLVNDAHMYFGIKFEGSLIECQYNCLSKGDCLGVDWNRKKRTCFLLSLDERGTVQYGLHYNARTNHYRRTHCYSTVASTDIGDGQNGVTPNPATAPKAETTTDANLHGGDNNEVNGGNHGNADASIGGDNGVDSRTGQQSVDFNAIYGQYPALKEFDRRAAKMGATEGVTVPSGIASTTDFKGNGVNGINSINGDDDNGNGVKSFDTDEQNFIDASTTTIPDSGCPYTFEKFEDTSHPFGNNITTGNKYGTEEECKHWCLIHSFCEGVDFDANTDTCYYHREIDTKIISSIAGVTHYRKTECEPPLKCWSQDTIVSREEDLSVTYPEHAQTTCHGVCFVSQTHSSTSTSIQRGCLTVTDPAMKPDNGCGVDKTMQTIVCFCDTPRCNGLSISALASQMLYLPLDNDLTDHSGIERHGQVTPGLASPEFQCLDKAVNCAALFTGNECVSVGSLATTAWGSNDNTASADFVPTATFAVWFKRVTNSPLTETQGIFGNSVDTNSPSWQIVGELLNDYIGAGVNTGSSPELDDYPFIEADNDEWHLAVLTYDGRYNVSAHQFPSLKFYIDCIPTMGNSKRDKGEIGVRAQPVSVGCVQDQFFVGFIDEARIFSTVLSMNDIRALKAMRDTNYFW